MNVTPRMAFAEFLSTFVLVFAGTGAVVVDALYGGGGGLGTVGIAACFGLVVMVMIYAVGETSGAHMNPAVTIAFAVAHRFPWSGVPLYVIAQSAGACLASIAVLALLGDARHLGATLPADPAGQDMLLPSWGRAFLLEGLFTWMLMFVILGVCTGAKEKGFFAGVAIGGTVALLACFGGPATGASMNPARSLGPALVSFELADLWLYIIAPIAGATLASLSFCVICPQDCCPGRTDCASDSEIGT